MLWDVSRLRRVRNCGRARTGDVVGVRHGATGAGFSGLQSCGSVWSCPVDSAKIMARRSLEIGTGLLTWEAAGGALLFGTLTMRHHAGDRLAGEWDALRDAWQTVRSSRVWMKWRQRLGSAGYVMVAEVNYGSNGWHVHLHFVLLIDATATDDEVDGFRSWLHAKWIRALAAAGSPGALDRAQDLRRIDSIEAASELGAYLSKSTAYGAAESLGRELMGSASKQARTQYGTDPAWSLAEAFGETGDMEPLGLWLEYEQGSKGRRQCTWSRGLRDRLGLGVEATDEEIAAEEAGDVDLVQITADGWRSVLRAGWTPSLILDAVEDGGVAGLRDFLGRQGIEFQEVDS